jgi:dsDNA-specific endonuclease/ATPase MutS2
MSLSFRPNQACAWRALGLQSPAAMKVRATGNIPAMAPRFRVGDAVQTIFGRGVIREVRNKGRLLVNVKGRTLVVAENEASAVNDTGKRARAHSPADRPPDCSSHNLVPRVVSAAIDLHGLTVEEALTRAEQALNDALLANLPELRLIHGRSGGRIRAALHQRLREIQSVREFTIDPHNDGVTIIRL